MVFQMLDIIFHYKFEREGSRIFNRYFICQKPVINIFDKMREMQIVGLPKHLSDHSNSPDCSFANQPSDFADSRQNQFSFPPLSVRIFADYYKPNQSDAREFPSSTTFPATDDVRSRGIV